MPVEIYKIVSVKYAASVCRKKNISKQMHVKI